MVRLIDLSLRQLTPLQIEHQATRSSLSVSLSVHVCVSAHLQLIPVIIAQLRPQKPHVWTHFYWLQGTNDWKVEDYRCVHVCQCRFCERLCVSCYQLAKVDLMGLLNWRADHYETAYLFNFAFSLSLLFSERWKVNWRWFGKQLPGRVSGWERWRWGAVRWVQPLWLQSYAALSASPLPGFPV